MLNQFHPDLALDMYKVEHQQRIRRLEHRQAALDRQSTSAAAPRPQVQAVRRATVALAGAGLALAALAAHLI